MIRRYLKTRAGKVLAVLTGFIFLFLAADLLWPAKKDVKYATLIKARDGEVLHMFLTHDEQWRFRAELNEITPELSKAIIFKEDKYFYYHPGINIVAIIRAAVNNLVKGRRTSGASTITMQVARMLEPKKRSYVNKLVEMWRALQLELHLSKDEILQLYFNLLPYGSNIQGVKAASLLYFDKSPDQLSLAEITALSIIPNRPNSLVMGKDNLLIEAERNKWLSRYEESKLFPPAVIHDAKNEPLLAYRHPAPQVAPQFAYRLRKMYPGSRTIFSTIDKAKQTQAEAIIGAYSNKLKLSGINNASVIVLDNQTHEVLCYVGSSDFRDRINHGQVDGVQALRSPGSTLKPLLYGLAFDAGLATPKTKIADVPTNFKGYVPENYDLNFRGNIAAEDALKLSLNIPAVKLLNEISVPAFITALSKSGFRSVWQHKNKLGLSMILGGCGVRLEELTNLYSALANKGSYYPPRFLKDSVVHADSGVEILSQSASYLLGRIMSELHRPDLPNLHDQASNIPRIAWKTGTSYGRRDAWSIGYNSRYTIGVWVGNFSGRGVAELNGAGTATPLLFQLFHAIDEHVSLEWLKPPADIGYRLVCTVSGKLQEEFCSKHVMDEYIPGRSSTQYCDHLKTVYVSADETISYCTSCLPKSGYRSKQVPNLSPELTSFYEAGNIAYEKLPAHNPACSRVFDGKAPVINSLTDNMTYMITDRGKQPLELGCQAGNEVRKVYWYINDRFYAAARADEKLFFHPDSPEVKISCTDDKGRNTNIRVKIKFI